MICTFRNRIRLPYCVKGITLALCLTSATLFGQNPAPQKVANYFQPERLHLALILPPSPEAGSAQGRQEMQEVLDLQRMRTPDVVARAQADDQEEDIFIFRDVLGKDFTAANLLFTATFSARLKNDSEIVDPPLKHLYQRPRPFETNSAVHPVCKLSSEPSYPSGHAMLGYLFGYVLAQMVPEQHDAIIKRAQEYAEHRLVCGVHFRSDIEASRFASAVLFGQMLEDPQFQKDLAKATQEIQKDRSATIRAGRL